MSHQNIAQLFAGGFNTGAWFQNADLIEPQPGVHVRVTVVLYPDLDTAQRCSSLLPARQMGLPVLLKLFAARPVVTGVIRVQLCHAGAQRAGNRQEIARVGLNMRVAFRMNVAHRSVNRRWHVQHPHIRTGLQITGLAALNRGVVGVSQQHRQPARFQPGAGGNEQIR